MAQALHRALAQIPLEFREVLLLRDVEGFSSQDVATTLGLADASPAPPRAPPEFSALNYAQGNSLWRRP
ncbi:MAG: hypothetical protein IPJ98_07245 [Bryobacterales bacterium]|nr:hypothetical protein [Bryobacterales bacterium]